MLTNNDNNDKTADYEDNCYEIRSKAVSILGVLAQNNDTVLSIMYNNKNISNYNVMNRLLSALSTLLINNNINNNNTNNTKINKFYMKV